MLDRPGAAELAVAVREFLEAEVIPQVTDHRLKFRALVAVNALGILGRELELGEGLERAECDEIRALLMDSGGAAVGRDEIRALPADREGATFGREEIGVLPADGKGAGIEPCDDADEPAGTALVTLRRALAERIRAGQAPEGTIDVVRRAVERKLRVASPRYLERVTATGREGR